MVSPAPKVSVVMAVYNERPYLGTAVQSILDQTFEDFEFLIVNDGSTDGSKKVLEEFGQSDDRIRLVHQENQGLIASLNRGLGMARGKYVARMDGDDISHPERFGRQVQFLNDSPEVGIVGTQANKIDAKGNLRVDWKRSLPTDPDVVIWRLLFNVCFCHPTVMMRRSVLEDLGGYAEWAVGAEDYELFTRAVLNTRLVNLPETLLEHRRHENSVSVKNREEYTQKCIQAATPLHRAILGTSVDERITGFLVLMERKTLGTAVEETGVRDYTRVHKYLRSLYEKCADRYFRDGSNVQVLRRVLRRLDSIANQITKEDGLIKGTFYKFRLWSVVTRGDIFPLLSTVLRPKIFR